MKKIFGLTVAALMVMGLIGGGTWAYFSDPETSTGNILTAGTLDLELGGTGQVLTAAIGNVKPGDGEPNGTSASVTLTNSGNLDGELDIAFDTSVTNTGASGAGEFQDESGDLGGEALIALYIDVDQSTSWNSGDRGLKAGGTVFAYVAPVTGTTDSGTTTTLTDDALTQADDFFNGMMLVITGGTGNGQARIITDFDAASDTITLASAFSAALDNTTEYSIANLQWADIDSYQSSSWDDIYSGAMASLAVDSFYVVWRIPTSVGNSIQGDQVEFDIIFTLEQASAD